MAAGEDAQPFKNMGDVGPIQTVVAMLSLHQDSDQIRCLQPAQVYACGRWTHLSHNCKLGACSRMAVHQAIENASSRRFADSRRNSRDRRVIVVYDIHTLILNESSMSGNRHNANGTSSRLKSDPEARDNFAMAQTKRLIVREERNFVEVVHGTFNLPSTLLGPT
jgi:hypothetical protein